MQNSEQATGNMLVLGKVSGVYGVKGWVKLFSDTEPREGILDYKHCFIKLKGQWQPLDVTQGRLQGKGVIAHIAGCDDRDQAMLLIGSEIAVSDDQLAELADDEYYWKDLIGLSVINQDNIDLGTVSGMMETGANDVLIVTGERERLLPFTQGHTVLEVNLDDKVIRVDWDPEF
ncbi:MAG: ribosome maturation factor RimM [Gammaproteobacteria bacterium]|nr:ribosome maturation factor RimM [Gammaproteobacteria bacterium]